MKFAVSVIHLHRIISFQMKSLHAIVGAWQICLSGNTTQLAGTQASHRQSEKVDLAASTTKATDRDLRDFRRIRSQQRRKQLDNWQGTRLRKTLIQINRALGSPWRIPLAARAALLGTYRSGTRVSAQHGIGIGTQLLEIFAEVMRSGILFEEYYLYRLYLPTCWRSRKRQFPDDSQLISAQQCLIEQKRPPHFQLLRDKHLFAAYCREAKLPSVPLLAQFVDGHPDRARENLQAIDLVSKPTNSGSGYGVESWRYDRAQDCFFNAMTDRDSTATLCLNIFVISPSHGLDGSFFKRRSKIMLL